MVTIRSIPTLDSPAGAKKLIRDWHNALVGKLPIQHINDLKDLVAVYYAWRHDQSLWSEAMLEIGQFPYRERMPFLCDVPTSKLASIRHLRSLPILPPERA